MIHITFDDLADYLKHGREIEFRYEGKEYSITNSHYEWNFCCDTDRETITLCAFPEFNVLVDKIRCLKIDGIRIEEIFNEHLGGLDVLDILLIRSYRGIGLWICCLVQQISMFV